LGRVWSGGRGSAGLGARRPVALTGTGTGAGLLCPPPVPAAAGGRGLRPRVSSAHRPWPQLQVQDPVMGRRPVVGIWHCLPGKG
jgi:hypothetical protein